ncbi:MAG: hypothetical protein Q9170_001347 [Blastenia crenularia]
MFEDCQRVQNLREKLLRTLVILDAQLEVAEGYSGYLCGDWDSKAIANRNGLLLELDGHCTRLKTHHKAVETMLNRSQGTLELVKYRNEEALSRNGAALHKDMESLRDIAHHTQRENEALVRLAEQSRKDGRALKALSVLGTLYLPATFVATMFSSSLIKAQPANETDNKTHFVPAEQFWLFIAVTGPLMLLTAGYMVWVDRR